MCAAKPTAAAMDNSSPRPSPGRPRSQRQHAQCGRGQADRDPHPGRGIASQDQRHHHGGEDRVHAGEETRHRCGGVHDPEHQEQLGDSVGRAHRDALQQGATAHPQGPGGHQGQHDRRHGEAHRRDVARWHHAHQGLVHEIARTPQHRNQQQGRCRRQAGRAAGRRMLGGRTHRVNLRRSRRRPGTSSDDEDLHRGALGQLGTRIGVGALHPPQANAGVGIDHHLVDVEARGLQHLVGVGG